MKYIKEGINIVVLLVGAFGGFLTNIAPPEDTLKFISGITLLTGVMIYLVVLGIKKFVQINKKLNLVFATISVVSFLLFLLLAFNYNNIYEEYVFEYGEELYVGCGNKEAALTGPVKQKLESGEETSATEIVTRNAMFRMEDTWIPEEHEKCKSEIKNRYFLSLSLFFASVFILTIIVLEDKKVEE